jgi:MarR family
MMLTSGAITHRIDRLEMLGLVQRVPDPDDRRSILVGLTKKGLAVIDRAIDGHLANESAILSQLTRNEQRLLADLLRKLVLALAGETRTPTRPGEAETVRNPRRVTSPASVLTTRPTRGHPVEVHGLFGEAEISRKGAKRQRFHRRSQSTQRQKF